MLIKKEHIKSLGLLVLAVLLIRSCTNGPDTITKTNTVFKTDTIVKTQIDTLYIKDTVTTVTQLPAIHDTVIINDDTTYVYTSEVEDSLLVGLITTKAKGEVIYTDIEYVAKFPKYINRVDSVFIHVPDGTSTPKRALYLGAAVGGSQTSFNFGPSVILKTKKDELFGLSYGFIDKSYRLSYHTKLKFNGRN
jgi:hypothetical protein